MKPDNETQTIETIKTYITKLKSKSDIRRKIKMIREKEK